MPGPPPPPNAPPNTPVSEEKPHAQRHWSVSAGLSADERAKALQAMGDSEEPLDKRFKAMLEQNVGLLAA